MQKITKPLTYLAIAANHNRLGMVFMIDKQPADWELSYTGASSPDNAFNQALKWIRHYGADVVITQTMEDRTRKGKWTMNLIDAIGRAAETSDAQNITVQHEQPFQSKYDQIDALIARYPQMQIVAPRKRRYWENEPHTVTLFEGLAMAERVILQRSGQ